MQIDITVDDARWDALDLAELASTAVDATLSALGVPPDICEISLLACDDITIAGLNAEFRGKPEPTNVLSWPAQQLAALEPGVDPDPPVSDAFGSIALGDIAISFQTCSKEADAVGKPIADHVTHLIVHGLLHLLGYDHIRDPDATLMEQLEVNILGRLGLDDPYRETDGL